MAEIESEHVFGFMDELLGIPQFPDYSRAVNGLQVEGPSHLTRVAAAVDAATYSIDGAVSKGADLLIVHHGLFWAGRGALTGRRFQRVARLVRGGVALYSAHLPLDAHPEIGNCAQLMKALELEPEARFGEYEGHPIGFCARTDEPVDELQQRVAEVLGGPVQLLPGGPQRVRRLAVITGSGADFVPLAARSGVDTILTGEAAHHTFVDASELGVNVLLGGHYRTETWGVKALATELKARFGLPWVFLDHPSEL